MLCKKVFEENLICIPSEDHDFYRKHKDQKLYDQLESIITTTNIPKTMAELLHKAISQLNETFNQSFTRYAQKNKHLSSSECLQIRSYVVVGVHIYGLAKY